MAEQRFYNGPKPENRDAILTSDQLKVVRQLEEVDEIDHGEYVAAMCRDAAMLIRALASQVRAASEQAQRMSRQ